MFRIVTLLRFYYQCVRGQIRKIQFKDDHYMYIKTCACVYLFRVLTENEKKLMLIYKY